MEQDACFPFPTPLSKIKDTDSVFVLYDSVLNKKEKNNMWLQPMPGIASITPNRLKTSNLFGKRWLHLPRYTDVVG